MKLSEIGVYGVIIDFSPVAAPKSCEVIPVPLFTNYLDALKVAEKANEEFPDDPPFIVVHIAAVARD